MGQCAFGGSNTGIIVTPSATTQFTSSFAAGGYFTMNVVSGGSYTLSTCGLAGFDTQLTVHDLFGVSLAYNDDNCSTQSQLSFSSTFTGQVRVRMNQYNCTTSGNATQVSYSGTIPIIIDSDGDGIQDSNDLDDDNDGITDVDESSTIINNSQPQCGSETTLDFSSTATLVSGSALSQGAVYRIANVTTGTDALITIAETNNATVSNLDDNGSNASSFSPSTSFSFSGNGEQGYVEYLIEFVNSGGNTPYNK